MFYKVTLWRGTGCTLNKPVFVEAHDEEEALVLASIADENCLYKEANEISVEEEAELEDSGTWIYLDRTEHGHSCIYLCVENCLIEDVTIKCTAYLEASLRGIMASENFDNIDLAHDWAYEQAQRGYFVEIRSKHTGRCQVFDPDNIEEIYGATLVI